MSAPTVSLNPPVFSVPPLKFTAVLSPILFAPPSSSVPLVSRTVAGAKEFVAVGFAITDFVLSEKFTSSVPPPLATPVSVTLLLPVIWFPETLLTTMLFASERVPEFEASVPPVKAMLPVLKAELWPAITMPPVSVMPPVNVLAPLSVSVPAPFFVSDPAPVCSAALIAKSPEPPSARFIPLPVMLVPLTVSVPPSFVQVCAAPSARFVLSVCSAAPLALVMPPVPMVSVFVPPMFALALPEVKLRLLIEKSAPSVFVRLVAPLVVVKNTSVVAPGIWSVFVVAPAVVNQFVGVAPVPKVFHCAPAPPFQYATAGVATAVTTKFCAVAVCESV